MRNILLFCLLFLGTCLSAQRAVNIALIIDTRPDSETEERYQQNVKDEINQLLGHRYQLTLNEYFIMDNPNNDAEVVVNEAYAQNDIIVGVGVVASGYLIEFKNQSKPTIASFVLNPKMQNLTITPEGTSGINNFTYLNSPFNLRKKLKTLYDIYPFEALVVVRQEELVPDNNLLNSTLVDDLPAEGIELIFANYDDDIASKISGIKDKKVGAFAFPYLGQDETAVRQMCQQMRNNKIPMAALFGDAFVEEGAFLGYDVSSSFQKTPRRLSLDIMKILEGQNPADLSVVMEMAEGALLINMETARQIGIYPNFDQMSDATLVNLDQVETDNVLSLNQAIAIALKNNLSVKIQEKQVGIQKAEVDIAKGDRLPDVSISTALNVVDDITALTYQGVQGQVNWLASGNVTQLIYSEPVFANIAIQKMLTEVEDATLRQQQYDIVIDVANAYMNILYAKNNLNIQQQNVARNKENYDISKNKEMIGYVGASDLNRWVAELANANINLNTAYANLRSAKFQLNQLLDRPISEPVEVEKTTLEESMLLVTDSRTGFVDSYGRLEKFANFLVDYSKTHLPELDQINLSMAIQKRTLKWRERALYMPSAQVSGDFNQILQKWQVPDAFQPQDNVNTWSIGLGASLPIFQGNKRKKEIEKSKLTVLQTQDTRKNIQNQLELRIRANLETVGASYSQMELSQTAADASRKNFEIVQDAYSAGQATVTTLIDAQNNALQTELGAINAVYTFILDFLGLERSIGYYNFLATEAERAEFFEKASQYILEE